MNNKIIDITDRLVEKEKRKNIKKYLENNQAKEMAKDLIDHCEGDFAIVFNKESANSIFDNITSEFVIAITDIDKIDLDNPEYFFKNFFMSKKYFDLNC